MFIERIFLISVLIKVATCFILHSTSACIEKNFRAFDFNLTEENDFPLQTDSAKCGEDGFFLTQNTHLRFLTVADGAGGWKKFGINPKFFVDEFLWRFEEKLKILSQESIKNHDSKKSLIFRDEIKNTLKFFNNENKSGKASIGSCTIASISVNLKTLHANSYYLGDAGFLIIRDGKIIANTKDQMHDFNTPYLIGNAGTHMNPSIGISKQFQLKVHDIIILATDGVLGNLFQHQILRLVNQESYFELKNEITCNYLKISNKIAKNLTVKAKKVGESRFNVWTPYAQEIYEANRNIYRQGKRDDTTVIVGIVSV